MWIDPSDPVPGSSGEPVPNKPLIAGPTQQEVITSTGTMALQISVITPVYNAGPHVEAAVDSALQFDQVKEVILVEDGSTDESLARCKALAERDPRVKLVQHPGGSNRGAGASRNLGIAHAQYPWVAFLDADDRFTPDRFEAEQLLLNNDPDVDGVYGAIGVTYLDEVGKERYDSSIGQELTTMHRVTPPDELFIALSGAQGYMGHFSLDGLTVRRAVLLRMEQLFNTSLRLHQDTEFLIRLAHAARLVPGVLDRPVALRGVHGGNRITSNANRPVSRAMMYEALYTWARRIGAERMATDHFRAKSILYRARAAATFTEHTRLFASVLRTPAILRFNDCRVAFIHGMVGTDSKLGRFLNKLGWYLAGK